MKKWIWVLLLGLLLGACQPGDVESSLGKHGQEDEARWIPSTADATYGYSEDNPIKVGGGSDSGPLREQWYLDRLVGSEGEKVQYERNGSCCSSGTNRLDGEGKPLDVYAVRYRGLETPALLYVDMYHCENPAAPQGFGLAPAVEIFTGTIYYTSMSAIFSGDYGLHAYAMDGETQCIDPLPIDAPAFAAFAISPDGTSIAYTISDETTSRITIYDPESRLSRQISPDGVWDETPAWSPIGNTIAFTRYDGIDAGIFLYDLETEYTTELFPSAFIEADPEWSPDGGRIAFVTDRSGNPDIYITNLDGTDIQQLTTASAFDISPTWSQQGQIAFASDREGSFALYTMDANGGQVTRLRTPRGDAGYPDWSPEGGELAYCLDDGKTVQIYTVNLDGDGSVQLTPSSGASCFPVWR